jgi:hypothetical protein
VKTGRQQTRASKKQATPSKTPWRLSFFGRPIASISINEPIGSQSFLTHHGHCAFVLNRLVFMSTLNEIPQPLGKLKGKVAVITGGATGWLAKRAGCDLQPGERKEDLCSLKSGGKNPSRGGTKFTSWYHREGTLKH